MKQIVFVIGNYKNGGVPMRSTNLANEFARRGYPSTILVTKDIAENIFFDIHKDVSIVSLKEYVASHRSDEAAAKILRKRRCRIRILKYLRYISKLLPSLDKKLAAKIRNLRQSEDLAVYAANNPDCVYIPFGIDYYVNTFYSLNRESKIIYAERTTPLIEFPKSKHQTQQIIKKIKKADGIILQTQNSFEFYKSFNVDATIINNPIKPNLPSPYVGEREKTVVTFCRVSPEKNLTLLIKAFFDFHLKHPEYSLFIYGNTVEKSEEEHRDYLNSLINELNAKDYIKLLPPSSNVHELVLNCAMFVSSSNYEGLSNSMIEALAIGLPCICTDCVGGGAREMIKNNHNGLIVAINDKKALCDAMCFIAENPNISKSYSKKASTIMEELSISNIADKWICEIKKITN